jgi:hypothetical protein
VPTISFRLLYGLLIMGHGRRQILWFGVTANPCACRKSNPNILVMQSAQDRTAKNVPGSVNTA